MSILACPQGSVAAITTLVHSTSPAWHRAARRKRARARRLLRTQWPSTPFRIMAAASNLYLHHGSHLPGGLAQSWVCTVCDAPNPITDAICQTCTYPAGFMKPPPSGMWRCGCGASNSYHYRLCRMCQASYGDRIRFPLHMGKGLPKGEQGPVQQMGALPCCSSQVPTYATAARKVGRSPASPIGMETTRPSPTCPGRGAFLY